MKRARVFGHLPRNACVTLTRDAVNPRGMELREIKEYFRPRRTLVAPANKSEICQPFYSRRANTPRESGKERCAATRETLRCGQRGKGRGRERKGGREGERKKRKMSAVLAVYMASAAVSRVHARKQFSLSMRRARRQEGCEGGGEK